MKLEIVDKELRAYLVRKGEPIFYLNLSIESPVKEANTFIVESIQFNSSKIK